LSQKVGHQLHFRGQVKVNVKHFKFNRQMNSTSQQKLVTAWFVIAMLEPFLV
jgi:hypothetical protein